MDFATVGGVLLAFASLIIGFTMDGGDVAALIKLNSLILILGGTLGATLASSTLRDFRSFGRYIGKTVFHKLPDPLDMIERLVELSTVARREGILALEERIELFDDEFLRNGIQLVVDGVDPELVRSMLETELGYIEERHRAAAKLFEVAGGYAPTMGIIGTVMGLVHVLGNLQKVDELGPQIATAFTATLYGVVTANVIWIPIANKLKRRNAEEVLLREMMIQGILSIQAGENPKILERKLKGFLAPAMRERKVPQGVNEGRAETAQYS
ncbi:MAG: flagellar motor protein [Alicyclobacillaceae bacterium]|nr:flagellar motor protein [Alicyclobacillaceae bacterium]